MTSRISVSTAILLTALFYTGCGSDVRVETPSASFEFNPEVRTSLLTIDSSPVEGLDRGAHDSFNTTMREKGITQFPCSTCHLSTLPPKPKVEAVEKKMHLDIVLDHAPAHVMGCLTCHSQEKPDSLRLNDGTSISFNQSYRSCTQCHFQQGQDWAGGAHGKRLGGWQGDRVVMNCTDCHNPHAPHFDQRWPKKTPRIPRTYGGEH